MKIVLSEITLSLFYIFVLFPVGVIFKIAIWLSIIIRKNNSAFSYRIEKQGDDNSNMEDIF